MPRPKPLEKKFPYTYRLTRKQGRKVTQMGGAEWLGTLISKAQATKHGRCPVTHVQKLKARNLDIASSALTTEELATKYKLSLQRVRQIRKQYSDDKDEP